MSWALQTIRSLSQPLNAATVAQKQPGPMKMKEHGCVPGKLYRNEQDRIWLMGHSWLTHEL